LIEVVIDHAFSAGCRLKPLQARREVFEPNFLGKGSRRRGISSSHSGGGEEADAIRPDFFGLLDDIVATDDGGASVGLVKSWRAWEEWSSRTRRRWRRGGRRFAGLADETDVVYGADFATLLVLKALAGHDVAIMKRPSMEV